MGKTTGISWTDSTWNPWRGCHKVSPGCKNCYMFREQQFYGHDPNTVVRAAPPTFNGPLKWKEPRRVFTCSWSDWFVEEADPWRDEAWDIVRRTPHIYQILTKRPENIRDRLPSDWGKGYPNVWLGVSIESQLYLKRADYLAGIPAKVRFISYEPALGPVAFDALFAREPGLFHWLISGGESDRVKPRPAKIEWFRDARDICDEHGVAYFHKQNGGSKKINGVWGGDDLDGRVYHEFPAVGQGWGA